MPAPKRSAPGSRSGVTAGLADGGGEELCSCCQPRNPLILRPDLGLMPDGSPEYALCVLHEPEPVVYRNRGDGLYVQSPHLSLNAAGEIVDQAGQVLARVIGSEYQRLTTVDDEEPPPGGGSGTEGEGETDRSSLPCAVHVDLSQDDFYSR